MVARKRKIGETFKAYRENLKGEAYALKRRLKGWWSYRTPDEKHPKPFRRNEKSKITKGSSPIKNFARRFIGR